MKLAAMDGMREAKSFTFPCRSRFDGHVLRTMVSVLLFAASAANGTEENSTDASLETSKPAPVSVFLGFRAECWTEVRDSAGKTLFQDFGKRGQRVRLEGVPPFELLVGNAGGVDIVVDGKLVAMKRYGPGIVKRLKVDRSVVESEINDSAGAGVSRNEDADSRSGKSVPPVSSSQPPVILALTFREKSWVEVRDGAGNTLFRDFGWGGQNIRLEGIVPFELLLGNAAGVDVVFDGKPFEKKQYRSGLARRFKLDHRTTETTPPESGKRPTDEADGTSLKPMPQPQISSPKSTATLELTFREKSWVEVRDGGGNTLFHDFGSSDQRIRIEGSLPFALLLGNARGVDLVFDGKPVAMEQHRSGVVKRLKLDRSVKDQGLLMTAWDRTRDPERWFNDIPTEEDPSISLDESAEGRPVNDLEYPRLIAVTDILLEYDSRFRAENSEEEFDDWLSYMNSDLVYHMHPNWFIKSDLRGVLEGENDGLNRTSTGFPDRGLYVRELRLQYHTNRYAIFGGKYDPLSQIFSHAPIFFGNYATDLNLEERVGLGGSFYLKRTASSEMRLSGHAFFVDESSLSGELFGGGARDGIANGQVGDTGKLNNFLATFSGGSTESNPGLRYTLGAGQQVSEEPDVADENARLASLFNITRLRNGADLELSLDLLFLKNAGGSDTDTDSNTVGAAYSHWPFLAGVAYSERSVHPGDQIDRITELIFRKGIADALSLEFAYQRVHESGEDQEAFGAVLRYFFE